MQICSLEKRWGGRQNLYNQHLVLAKGSYSWRRNVMVGPPFLRKLEVCWIPGEQRGETSVFQHDITA